MKKNEIPPKEVRRAWVCLPRGMSQGPLRAKRAGPRDIPRGKNTQALPTSCWRYFILFHLVLSLDQGRYEINTVIPSLVTREGMTVYISYLPWYETLVLVLQMDMLAAWLLRACCVLTAFLLRACCYLLEHQPGWCSHQGRYEKYTIIPSPLSREGMIVCFSYLPRWAGKEWNIHCHTFPGDVLLGKARIFQC